jgi:hypothetical protein
MYREMGMTHWLEKAEAEMEEFVNGVSAARTLAQLVRGSLTTQLISVASTLGIAELLQSGPKSAGEIAATVEADASALYRMLRALAGMGIFAEGVDGRFEMTSLAEPLRRDAPESVHSSAELYGSTWWWDSTGALLHTVRSERRRSNMSTAWRSSSTSSATPLSPRCSMSTRRT